MNFTVHALVQTRTETVKPHRWDADTQQHIPLPEVTRTEEVGRMEFVPMGEWTLIRMVRTPGAYWSGGCWEARPTEEARKVYQAHLLGEGWYRGKWTPAEATTRILGSESLPARRVDYQWGETAYMYSMVDLPAMVCPVIEMDPGRACALQPFTLKVGPTKGDPYGHTSHRIKYTEVKVERAA